jgi:hypothetical protein
MENTTDKPISPFYTDAYGHLTRKTPEQIEAEKEGPFVGGRPAHDGSGGGHIAPGPDRPRQLKVPIGWKPKYFGTGGAVGGIEQLAELSPDPHALAYQARVRPELALEVEADPFRVPPIKGQTALWEVDAGHVRWVAEVWTRVPASSLSAADKLEILRHPQLDVIEIVDSVNTFYQALPREVVHAAKILGIAGPAPHGEAVGYEANFNKDVFRYATPSTAFELGKVPRVTVSADELSIEQRAILLMTPECKAIEILPIERSDRAPLKRYQREEAPRRERK